MWVTAAGWDSWQGFLRRQKRAPRSLTPVFRSRTTTYSDSPSRAADFCRFTHPAIGGYASIWTGARRNQRFTNQQLTTLSRIIGLGPGRSHGLQEFSPSRGRKRVYLPKMGFNFDTGLSLHLSSTYHNWCISNKNEPGRARSWICAVVLAADDLAESAHMCGLAGDLRLHHGEAAQADNIDSPSICAICASSDSPSFAVSLTSLPSIDSRRSDRFNVLS